HVDVFGIDFIGILYNVYGRLNDEGKVWDMKRFLIEVERALLDLMRMISPRRMTMIMFDGTPPLAKIDQQRKRRYRAALEASQAEKKDEPQFAPFPSSAFSPGTSIMFEVEEQIQR